jgi:multidrug resistance protein, MATE family
MDADTRAPSLRSEEDSTWMHAIAEVIRVALPLMISTATFSLVLFVDRTLLLRYDGASMSASMAAGNLYWSVVCLPMGIASMTGAIISQMVGANQQKMIGRFLWQSVWFSLMTLPMFASLAYFAPDLFQLAEQPDSLRPLETIYMRTLLLGAVGTVLESALSGFYSGTERTSVIMWISIAASLLNFVLDLGLIFGFGPIPEMGIAGAGLASSISFWFKALCFGVLLLRPKLQKEYGITSGFGFDMPLFRKLVFFGFPTGLMYLTEAGGFTIIVLRIGRLGDVPLRATTMAINFNMVAFIPLVGVSIATSVLVGRHLIQSGSKRATRSVVAALAIGWAYSLLWAIGYVLAPDEMLWLYEMEKSTLKSTEAIALASGLLKFVAFYVLFDATQLIIAGALRGAGDTWFVLGAGFTVSVLTLAIGLMGELYDGGLTWWWWMVTLWVWLLAASMTARFLQGSWKRMRMV